MLSERSYEVGRKSEGGRRERGGIGAEGAAEGRRKKKLSISAIMRILK
jgi:hypothetical protein